MSMHTQALEGGFANPVLGAQATFRALMDAMSRPGTIHTLNNDAAPPHPLGIAQGAAALTLADHDTPGLAFAGARHRDDQGLDRLPYRRRDRRSVRPCPLRLPWRGRTDPGFPRLCRRQPGLPGPFRHARHRTAVADRRAGIPGHRPGHQDQHADRASGPASRFPASLARQSRFLPARHRPDLHCRQCADGAAALHRPASPGRLTCM